MASAEGDSRQSSNGRIVSRRAGADNGPNPAVRQRELGMRRRELRDGLGLTVDHVAKQLECSATKVSRLETEARRASLRVVPDLCGIYRVTDLTDVDDLMNLARQAPEHGWWTRYDDLNLSTYIGQEQEAVAITSFSMYYVPPLIQTSDYARVIIKGIVPKMDPEMIDQRVEARLRRQRLLEREFPMHYRVLLDEAVLYRYRGRRVVRQTQIYKILRCTAGTHGRVRSSSWKDFSAICTRSARLRSSDTRKHLSTCATRALSPSNSTSFDNLNKLR